MALGDCYLQQARYQEAILYYEKARELAGKEGDREEEHKIILKLAQCYERVDLNKFQEYVTELYKIEMAVEQEKELSVH